MKSLLIAVLLIYSFGCSTTPTKHLTIIEDAIGGAANLTHVAYQNHLLTHDDVAAAKPYFDAARDSCLKVELARAQNIPEIFWPLPAAETALSELESRPEVVKAHAVKQVTP